MLQKFKGLKLFQKNKSGHRKPVEKSSRKSGLFHRFLAKIGKYQNESERDGYILCFLLLPLLLVFLIECLSSHSLLGGFRFIIFHPYAYLINVIMVAASFTLSLFFRKRIGAILSISFLWLLCGLVNCIVLFFRVTPLTSSDLLLIKEAQNISAKYLNIFSIVGIVILLALLLTCCFALLIRCPSGRKPPYIYSIPVLLAAFLLTWGAIHLGQYTGGLETEFRELAQSYRKNGFLYCFGASLIDTGISKPDDYSTETIEQLTEHYELAENGQYNSTRPNIVIVQLESFFDVNRLTDITFSQNPIPNFTKLMADYPSGLLSVPVMGAGTVNSEFEVLTGMNIDDFGIGEYPYKTVVKEKSCESLAFVLKDYGYKAFAIHNHEGDFYERNLVYPNLGFDVFTSVEYMWPSAYNVLDWAKDSVLVEEIEKAMDSTAEQDFVFTVSVQGHGSYPSDAEADYVHHVTVSSSVIEDEAYLNQISYYVNQLYEMDQFVGELLEMLKSRKEPTILVMYGDHLPSLELTDDVLADGTVYDTEYFIWNNNGIVFSDQNLQAYQLGSEVLGKLKITDGAVNAYHQSYRKLLKDGSMTEEDYLLGLQELEYDILYGDQIRYGGESPYTPTILQMGLNPVTIDLVYLTRDNVLVVEGENFTRYSTVLIDGEEMDTLYLDPETLAVADVEIEDNVQITVAQSTLSETVPYAFRTPMVE